jgi:Spy/CpxP family protein refolding chaperone
MKGVRFSAMVLLAGLMLLGMTTAAFAQAQGGGGRQGRGQRGQGGGNFDPARFQQRMMDRMKEQLGASDDEWKVLQPKVEKVMNAQRDSRGNRFGFGGLGGRGPGNNNDANRPQSNRPQSEVSKAAQELRTVLDDKSASAEEITKKLTALRQAREKAKAELVTAQKELKELLTARQEAILVSDGMLE